MSNIYIQRIMVNPVIGKCNVTFRNGINVVWAENVKQEPKGTDFRNSVGKTTFIMLVDFLLGKKKYITNPIASGDKRFINSYLLAEVILGDEKYTISRRLIDGEENRVYEGHIIGKLIRDDEVKGKPLDSDGYIDFLTEKIYGNNIIINNKKYVTHRSIMAYLIRDQFWGFTKYNSGLKEEQGTTRKKRLEYLLGLVTEQSVLLEGEITELDNQKSKLSTEKNTLKNYFDYISDQTYTELKAKKHKIERKLEQIEEELDEAESVKILLDEEIRKKSCENEELLLDIKRYTEELSILKNRLVEYEKTVNDIDNEDNKITTMNTAYQIFKKINYEKCPIYLKKLNDNSKMCDFIEYSEEDDKLEHATEARRKIIQMEKKEVSDAIKRVQKHISQLSKVIEKSRKRLSRNHDVIEQLKLTKVEKYDNINDEAQENRHELELLEKDIRNFKYLDELSEKITKKKKDIDEKKDLLNELKKNRAFELNKYYTKVVEYITNNERKGVINYHTYEPNITYLNGVIDKGAGMKNAAILAFDIAMLELSLNSDEVLACRPPLLIHDSPKMHDLDLAIYYRLMDYVIEMEKNYPDNMFQYIITTLDISSKIANNLNTYVRLRLDNSGDGGKLYGCTVDID